MMTHPFLRIACLLIVIATTDGLAASYTNTVPVGASYLCNQLDHGSNTADLVISSPVNLDGSQILKWTCGGYTVGGFYLTSGTGFLDSGGNPIPPPSLPPGGGFVFNKQAGVPVGLGFPGRGPTPPAP